MKTILYGALALGALASLASAKNEAKSTWMGLDEELHALSSNINVAQDGPRFGAVLKTVYTHTDEEAFGAGAPPLEDISGFLLYNARLWAEGDFGDVAWRLSFDFGDEASNDFGGDQDAQLLDAYARWQLAEMFAVTWGQFLFPTLMGTSDDPFDLLFINRTRLAQAFYEWQLGAMASGDYEALRWFLAIQNGEDGIADEHRFSGRVEFDLGEGRRDRATRSSASRDMDATIGVFGLMDDDGTDDVTVFGADARLWIGAFQVGAEIASVDDGGLGVGGGATGTPFLDVGFDDATPWSLYAAYGIVPDEWELAVRWEDLDDDTADATVLTAGVNWYPENAPAKWQLNWISVDADDEAADGDAIQLGLVVGLNT